MMISRILFWTLMITIIIVLGYDAKLTSNHDSTDPEVVPYADAVARISKGQLTTESVNIGFVSSKYIDEQYGDGDYGNILAVCSKPMFSSRFEIDINREVWNTLSDFKKFFTIAHELYHCVCKQGHTEGTLRDGCPVHYMHPVIINDDCLKGYLRFYVDQVRRGCDA